MASTEFSSFAQKMATVFQKEQLPEEFTKSLFAAIYFPDTDEDPVDELLPRSYKAYFYGQNDISHLAKKISYSLDPNTFAEEFCIETDGSIDALCDVFKEDCPEINSGNYGIVLAERFKQIILNAAAPNKRKKPSNEKGIECRPSLKDKHGAYLVTEAGNCPNDGCSHSLYIRENGQLNMVYDIAVIDPDCGEDNTDNLIAMCPACCARYSSNRSPEVILRMKEIKRSLLDLYEAQEITGGQSIQDSVRLVIEQIPKMQKTSDVDLNFDPVPVRSKINADNDMLYAKAQMHVNLYYPAVNDAFIALSNEKKLRFTPFCQQVRLNYLNLNEKGYDQETIYYQMTKWLCDATNGSWNACEIVISYFIQKCEVFDVITE